MRERIYLDHNATAPLRPEARDATLAALDLPGNPSSVHAEGRAARRLVEDARERIAACLKVAPSTVYFTSGGTEAANWFLFPVSGGAVLHIGATEHPCVTDGNRFPAERIRRLPVDGQGRVDPGALDEVKAGDIVSIQAANNESGVRQDIGALAARAREKGAFFICDAVQIVGRFPADDALLSADGFFFSAHKFGGPKGVGAAVLLNDAFRPEPLIRGGGQEKRQRSGTENVAGIAGMAVALEAAAVEADEFSRRALAWRGEIEAAIRSVRPDAVIFGEEASRLSNTTFVAIDGLPAETALIALDLEGVAISSGSACASGKVALSPVLSAMGVRPELATCALRISTGWTTKDNDIERFLSVFTRICAGRDRSRAA